MANSNFIFRTANEALPRLFEELRDHGEEVGSRAGRVRELTHVGITLREPWRREILVPGRKPNIAAQIAETAMVIAGRNNVEWLSNYLPRAKDFSDDGRTWRAGYGTRIRNWESFVHLDGTEFEPGEGVDQLAYVVDTLRENPLSRQAVISIWDPTVDTEPGKDIPCNDWLSFSSRLGKLDLHVAVRSNDAMWGWSGINAFEWSALQEIVAGLLGLQVGSLHFSTTSFHLYEQHWAKADKIAENTRYPIYPTKDSPRFQMPHGLTALSSLDNLLTEWFQLEYYIRTGSPLVDGYIEKFPEPMLRSWLRVLQWWWGDNRGPLYLTPLKGTALEEACIQSVQPPTKETLKEEEPVVSSAFIENVIALHDQKHAAYGDSWKRRGEMLGIMANIARKIDRLGGSATDDETSADTAIDLFVYLAKYRVWLSENKEMPVSGYTLNTNSTTDTNTLMRETENSVSQEGIPSDHQVEEWLTKTFDRLEEAVLRGDRLRYEIVDAMLDEAYLLARYRWDNSLETSDEYQGADGDDRTESAHPHHCVHTTSGRGHACNCDEFTRHHPKLLTCEVEI